MSCRNMISLLSPSTRLSSLHQPIADIFYNEQSAYAYWTQDLFWYRIHRFPSFLILCIAYQVFIKFHHYPRDIFYHFLVQNPHPLLLKCFDIVYGEKPSGRLLQRKAKIGEQCNVLIWMLGNKCQLLETIHLFRFFNVRRNKPV